MNRIKFAALAIVFVLGFVCQTAIAGDMDDFEGLAEDSVMSEKKTEIATGSDLDLFAENEDPVEYTQTSEFSLSFGGYAKGVTYWNQEAYSDDLWVKYQDFSALGLPAPEHQDLSGYNSTGARIQLKLEGYLGDKAHLFGALNLDFNNADAMHPMIEETETLDFRLIETFIEIYEHSRTWKIGPQIVTWGFLEGLEVPTDRVNARDYSYKSTEYEDTKIPSIGILLTQRLGNQFLELMYIPRAETNTDIAFIDYFYTDDEIASYRDSLTHKYAGRFYGTVYNLDYALSYVEGGDLAADIITRVLNVNGVYAPVAYRNYNRVKSPGIDLQYNFGNWLAKGSFIRNITEDSSGDSPFIKNTWNKYLLGAEFKAFEATYNVYAGQILVDDFPEDPISAETNFLLGQLGEKIDFISGHVSADFFPGNALNLIFMGANYWDRGETIQTNIRATLTYKIANGLEVLVSPTYMYLLDNIFYDMQAEVKYSF